MIFMKISLIPIILDLPSVAQLAQVFSIALVGQTETLSCEICRSAVLDAYAVHDGWDDRASLRCTGNVWRKPSVLVSVRRGGLFVGRREGGWHHIVVPPKKHDKGLQEAAKAHAAGQVLPTQKEEDEDETRE